MYAPDRHKSAKTTWNRAPAGARVRLLRAAGVTGGLAHAYQCFDDLPPVMKLDLNHHVERQGEADARSAGTAPGAHHAR